MYFIAATFHSHSAKVGLFVFERSFNSHFLNLVKIKNDWGSATKDDSCRRRYRLQLLPF